MLSGITPNWRFIGAFAVGFMLLWIMYNSHSSDVKSLQTILDSHQSADVPRKVQTEVYYEVLCPDSRHFVKDQLYPTWKKLSSIMDVQFKPYGKAKQFKDADFPGGFRFECQHGPVECTGNTIHACAAQHVKDQDKLVDFITCMITDNMKPFEIGKECATKFEVDWTTVTTCSDGPEGSHVLASIGDDTASLRPKVSFIPTIVVNGKQDDQNIMLKNLSRVICRSYDGPKPTSCS